MVSDWLDVPSCVCKCCGAEGGGGENSSPWLRRSAFARFRRAALAFGQLSSQLVPSSEAATGSGSR